MSEQKESTNDNVGEQESVNDYPNEQKITNILMKVTNVLELNRLAHDPIFAAVVAHEVLRNNGYHPSFATGYLFKPDAPGIVVPYAWVETSPPPPSPNEERVDITDLTPFPDKSKHIFILGYSMKIGEESQKCQYYKRCPEGMKVQEEGVPTISAIQKTLKNVDYYIAQRTRSNPVIKQIYDNILEKAIIDTDEE